MFIHRTLKDSDAEIICTFPKSAEELFYMFPKAAYPLTPRQLLETAKNRHNPTVVLADSIIAGYANFIQVRKNEFCSVGNVVVNPILRRKGAASYLIREMVGTASYAYSAKYVRISCFNNNTSGLLLYHKLGFRPVEIEQRQTPDNKRAALIHMHFNVRS